MKKQLFGTFAMLSLLLALAVVHVQAQTSRKLTANVPFAFQVGETTLPAGEYSIKRISQNAVLVQSADGERSVIAHAQSSVENNANAKPSKEKLVFRQYGDKYFLAQVWMTRGGAGRELNMTEAERAAAKELKLTQRDAKLRLIEVSAR